MTQRERGQAEKGRARKGRKAGKEKRCTSAKGKRRYSDGIGRSELVIDRGERGWQTARHKSPARGGQQAGRKGRHESRRGGQRSSEQLTDGGGASWQRAASEWEWQTRLCWHEAQTWKSECDDGGT